MVAVSACRAAIRVFILSDCAIPICGIRMIRDVSAITHALSLFTFMGVSHQSPTTRYYNRHYKSTNNLSRQFAQPTPSRSECGPYPPYGDVRWRAYIRLLWPVQGALTNIGQCYERRHLWLDWLYSLGILGA